jgi:diketogulonate reductase-like aldo/keto reductase
VGVSNFSAGRWAAAERSSGAVNQVQFNLCSASPTASACAQEHDRIVIAYSPLGQGVLGGHTTANPPPVRRG